MQQIDFHSHVPNRILYACQVARTVYRRGLTLAVWCSDARRLEQFNSLLWDRFPLEFIPHVEASHPESKDTPVVFGTQLAQMKADVLLLLDDYLPPDWQEAFVNFSRIIDVVSTDENEVQLSRQRYLAYKRAGVELKHYNRSN